MKTLTLLSYAKLNLYLKVLNRREDGYHNIKTIFERISLCDTIIIKPRRDNKIKIFCDAPGVPVDSSNLAFRSARALREAGKVNYGADIKIIKRIPVGAGLGGGSSNAAAVLTGLNKLWRLNFSRKILARIAADIGSDVPFFIYDIPFGAGSGRGERIKPLAGLGNIVLWHIILMPKIKVSTPLIYDKWDAFSGLTSRTPGAKILTLALQKRSLPLISRALSNSLEMVTAKLYPQVNQAKEKLTQSGLKSCLMSGSGPAVFGIVSSRKEAVALSSRLGKGRMPFKIFAAKTV